MNISIQKGALRPAPHPRRHEARVHTMNREIIIKCLTNLNTMNKKFNKGSEYLLESPDKLTKMAIEDLRELYIEITGRIF